MLSRLLLSVVTCAALAGPLVAQESICLHTGFCLEADSHTQQAGVVQLRTRGGGTMEIAADQISEIFVLGEAPPPPPPVQNVISHSVAPEDFLLRAAIEQGLEPDFVRSVARIESGLRQDAISPKGALGVMQLMPTTAAELGVNPKLAGENALGGAKFLRQLLLRYGGNSALALAAYNAGPGAVDKFGGVPPYLETRQYVIKVLREYARQQRQAAAASKAASKPSATN